MRDVKTRRGDFVSQKLCSRELSFLIVLISFVFRKLLRFIGTTNDSRLLKYHAIRLLLSRLVLMNTDFSENT